MARPTWKDTRIYKNLENKSKHDSATLVFLNYPKVMSTVDIILSKGGTSPKDFTLHDDEHAFRVAEKAWDISSPVTREKLSDEELALLLLACYTHDIGMCPNFVKVEALRTFLGSENKSSLSDEEINDLQQWLDASDNLLPINIRKDIITDDKVLSYILSYYVRYRHNDWSENWIRENFVNIKWGNYENWVDDLVTIAKSHHEGLDALKSGRFDAKPSGSTQVHLRYLAMCLRVADVMENDPERTPEVLLQHRQIATESIKYWIKDHKFTLLRSGNKFTIYARPESAQLHKAVEETATQIENELRICDDLVRIKPVNYSAILDLNSYLWEIEPFLARDIVPKDGKYVFIQGAFKPNVPKLLELLGGTQLYGNSRWAIRELLQNAFDSIKERIAYQVIDQPRPYLEIANALENLYSIDISLEKRQDGFWLTCADRGVGMTKNIIEKFFLESGSSKRAQVIELERKCQEHGFHLGRTGQFGIGVLSYFMIAEKIVVTTRREQNTGYDNEELVGWRFEINGTHDFGELSKYQRPIAGTKIELKLQQQLQINIKDFHCDLVNLLRGNILKAPCSLTYKNMFEPEEVRIDPNWTVRLPAIRDLVIDQFQKKTVEHISRSSGLLSSQEQRLKDEQLVFVENIASEMRTVVEFLYEEGVVENWGRYRIHLPYFNLANGKSLYYFHELKIGEDWFINRLLKGYYWIPDFSPIKFSLKGIAINVANNRPWLAGVPLQIKNAFVEVDFENIEQSKVLVNRHYMELDKKLEKVYEILNSKINVLIQSHTQDFNNFYAATNIFSVNNLVSTIKWPFYSKKYPNLDKLCWNKLIFPLTKYDTEFKEFGVGKYRGKLLQLVVPLPNFFGEKIIDHFGNVRTRFDIGLLSTVYIYLYSSVNVKPILSEAPQYLRPNDNYKLGTVSLPNSWSNVLVFCNSSTMQTGSMFINDSCPLSKFYDSVIFAHTLGNYQNLQVANLKTEEDSLAFVLSLIANFSDGPIEGVYEKFKSQIDHSFHLLRATKILVMIPFHLLAWTPKGRQTIEKNKTKNFLANNDDQEFLIISKKAKLGKSNKL